MTRRMLAEMTKGETRKYRRQYTKCRKHAECRSRPGNIWYKEPKK